MDNNIDNIKKLIDLRSIDWERIETNADQLYDFIKNNLDINQWEVYVKGYGKMPFQDFMTKSKKEISFGRYIEVTEAQHNLLENIQVHFDVVENRMNDVFRSLINITEEKKFTIDQVMEEIDVVNENIAEVENENNDLKEENKKLRELIDFSNNSYEEFSKIVEYKINDIDKLYNNFSNIKDKRELKAYFDAILIELKVGRKPIQAKKNFILKRQREIFGTDTDELLKEVVEEKIENVEVEVVEENNLKPNIDEYKKQFEKVKNGEDYIVSDDEIKLKDEEKYSTFEIHKGFMYDENDYNNDETYTDEEKEARSKLIKKKNDKFDYCLEEEVDYFDRSNENKSKIASLVQLDMEFTHLNLGVNSVQWLNKYKDLYKLNLDIILKGKMDEKFNPTQLKHLEKLKRKNG